MDQQPYGSANFAGGGANSQQQQQEYQRLLFNQQQQQYLSMQQPPMYNLQPQPQQHLLQGALNSPPQVHPHHQMLLNQQQSSSVGRLQQGAPTTQLFSQHPHYGSSVQPQPQQHFHQPQQPQQQQYGQVAFQQPSSNQFGSISSSLPNEVQLQLRSPPIGTPLQYQQPLAQSHHQQQPQQQFYQPLPNEYAAQRPVQSLQSSFAHHHQQQAPAVVQRVPQSPAPSVPVPLPSAPQRRSREAPALKSPPVNTQQENERLMREQAEREQKEKRERDAKEKLRIQEELKRRREEAKEFADNFRERIEGLPEPTLVTCHTLSKVSSFIPFPSECASTSTTLPCFEAHRINSVLSRVDGNFAQYLSAVLTDTTEDIREIELKHNEEEMNELEGALEGALLTPLAQAILNFNACSFNVEADMTLNDSEIEQAFGGDIQAAVEEVTSGRGMRESDDLTSFEPLSVGAVEHMGAGAEHSQQSQLRMRQMVSVGKQPKKAGSNRKKRDMVEALYDSLTGYFDPMNSKERRRRGGRVRSSEDEESETDNNNRNDEPSTSAGRSHLSSIAEGEEGETTGRFFDKGHRPRKRARQAESEEDRPPTPTEIIQQREIEWHERQRQRQEKYRRRQHESSETQQECWNNDREWG